MAVPRIRRLHLYVCLAGLLVLVILLYFAKLQREVTTHLHNHHHHHGHQSTEPVFQRKLNRVGNSPDNFSLVSYNILKDNAITTGRYLPLSNEENVKGVDQNSPRHKLLMKEIKWLRADIMNFQEVQKPYYDEVLSKDMGSLGYDGVFHLHGEGIDGVATFYMKSKFNRKEVVAHNFAELLETVCDHDDLDKFTVNPRFVLFTLLEEKETGKQLIVANTHIMFLSWRFPAAQAIQIALFLRNLHKFASSVEEGRAIPWVFSGDFNIYPHYPAYELVTTGKVSPGGLEKLNVFKYKYPQVTKRDEVEVEPREDVFLKHCSDKLSHPLGDLKSAYKTILGSEPPLSHYQINENFPELYGFKVMKGTLDYIFYSSNSLEVNAVLEPVKEDVIKPLVACPNKYFPSDHLSTKAWFSFK